MQSKTISDLLIEGNLAAVGKIGFSEMKVLYASLTGQSLNQQDLHDIFVVAGVFPPDEASLVSFIEEMNSILPEVDVIAKMGIDQIREDAVINHFAKQAKLSHLRELEPYYWDEPWSKQLKSKKILVISPFTDTIEKQYVNRRKVWKSNLLPTMKLKFLKAPMSHYIRPSKYTSWEEALNDIKYQMSIVDFDVCLVGAGAWSLPLVAYAKFLGKIGIHLGGSLQILFGIKGKRWDDHEVISKFYNEHWVRPSKEESPDKNSIIEGGCYW